ncbi:hypothetical protein YC2023_045966 [Brassica napus]
MAITLPRKDKLAKFIYHLPEPKSVGHNDNTWVKFKRGIRTPLHGRLGAKPKSVGFVQTILEKGNMVVTFCSGEARVLASEVVKLISLDRGQHVRLRKDVREPIM